MTLLQPPLATLTGCCSWHKHKCRYALAAHWCWLMVGGGWQQERYLRYQLKRLRLERGDFSVGAEESSVNKAIRIAALRKGLGM